MLMDLTKSREEPFQGRTKTCVSCLSLLRNPRIVPLVCLQNLKRPQRHHFHFFDCTILTYACRRDEIRGGYLLGALSMACKRENKKVNGSALGK